MKSFVIYRAIFFQNLRKNKNKYEPSTTLLIFTLLNL